MLTALDAVRLVTIGGPHDDNRTRTTPKQEATMPGTLMLDAYEMSVEDALSILLVVGDPPPMFFHGAYPHELDELRGVARSIVEAHAAEVVRRCVPRLNPEPKPPMQGLLKVVQGGKDHD